ncbi:hypothetical protein GOP47_0014435 [Adiantum capillus-veneris]|uniref:MYB transcription factor n=1 Tax=Adiantum capillus-veneris TaxID=13818 RepID=A0A9D4UMA4_ADICA|nr:hypothetical protein GOP47_0014435 [Adiantum capillus-veneris]
MAPPSCSSAGSPAPSYEEEAASPSLSTPSWTPQQDKLFELALAAHDLGAQNCWDSIAAAVPGHTVVSVKAHFDTLLEDIQAIEAGLIALPLYPKPHFPSEHALGTPLAPPPSDVPRSKKDTASSNGTANGRALLSKAADLERRKGVPWTEEEHKNFLLGLAKFGKGDWRSISRNFVRTRTPTQVASHAQKYFIRLTSIKKDRRRSSIHDITSVNGDAVQPCQGPITGQGVQGHPPSNPPGSFTESSHFGEAVGQPISGIMGSTVGTPVMMPPASFTGPFVSRGPLPRPMVPGAPVGVMPVPYPLAQSMPPTASQQVGSI